MVLFRSKSEEINKEDVQYYCTERCAEAGEEYDSEFKWIESESEVDNDRSSGCGSGVLEGSSSEYASPTIIRLEFVHPLGRGFAPDVREGLIGPGCSGVQEDCLEESQARRDHHS